MALGGGMWGLGLIVIIIARGTVTSTPRIVIVARIVSGLVGCDVAVAVVVIAGVAVHCSRC